MNRVPGITSRESQLSQRHLSGEGCAGEIQLKVFPLEQLNVLPQGVEGKIHSF